MTQAHDDSTIFAWLHAFLDRHGAASGTVHLRDMSADLELVAACNIPPHIVALIQSIPKGKGMAGLAWERNQPISTCNIKTDTSGDIRPVAKTIAAQAAVALPVHHDGEVVGIVGIAFSDERALSNDDLLSLNAEAELVPRSD